MDIRLDAAWPTHPKTLRLQQKLGPDAPLRLIQLWVWAAVYRPDGDLSGLDFRALEMAAGWVGEPGDFVAALDGDWLDGSPGTYKLHDWAEHQAYVCHAKERAKAAKLAADARWNARRNAEGNAPRIQTASCPVSGSGSGSDSGSDSGSGTGKKKKNTAGQRADPPPGFVRFWQAYPYRNGRKAGKAQALRVWKEIKAEPKADEIIQRLQLQIEHKRRCDSNGKFCPEFKDASGYLKQRRFNDEILSEG